MDKKAKVILLKTYWRNGWIDEKKRHINPSDFEYAKSKGLMFDTLTISHDTCLNKILDIVSTISQEKAAQAFLSSLSTRRLDWRSGLASYFIAQQLAPHQYAKVVSGHGYQDGKIVSTSYTCGICKNSHYGIIGDEEYKNVDLNVLNFERIKWGGVRHGNLLYTLFDLQQLEKADIPKPTKEDIEIFTNILGTIEESKPQEYPSRLEERLSSVLKSTKNERKMLLEILGCVDILKPQSFDRPSKGKNDWKYVEFWRGEDKYSHDSVRKYFSQYI